MDTRSCEYVDAGSRHAITISMARKYFIFEGGSIMRTLLLSRDIAARKEHIDTARIKL